MALAGGGPLGAVYEIGALSALDEAIDGLDVNDLAIYVGISAGGIVAAALANGITPRQMHRLYIENDGSELGVAPFRPEDLLVPAWREFRHRLPSAPAIFAAAALKRLRFRRNTGWAASFEGLKELLPSGVFSSQGIEAFLAQAFSTQGRTNDFRKLGKRLIIVASDLDSGASVEFGQPGLDAVPISKAAQASAAVPGLFTPVEIDGQFYVDGALRKTLHASTALRTGVDLLFCLNPIVPYNAKPAHGSGKLAQRGLLGVLSQALRTIIHSRVEIGMANYRHTYPDADIILIEPSSFDAEMFFTSLFGYNTRQRMCENAYQQTRAMLWQRRDELDVKLARHGLKLNRATLCDTSATLTQPTSRTRDDRFGTRRLHGVLDQLERQLRMQHD